MENPADQTDQSSQLNAINLESSSDRKVVRRRFVQTTLFPLKPNVSEVQNWIQKEVNKSAEVAAGDDNEEGKRKRGRKPKGTITPQKRGSKVENFAKKEVKKVEEIAAADDDDAVEVCGCQGRKSKVGRIAKGNSTPRKREAKKVNDSKVEEVGDDDEDVEFCGSQGRESKRGRTATPQKRVSKKAAVNGKDGSVVAIDDSESLCDESPQDLRGKQRVSTRNGRTSGNKAISMSKVSTDPVAIQQSPQPVPDLWLEAKKTAEENSRIFAGKQIHPFFSSRKLGKKDLETFEVENVGCLDKRKEKIVELAPVHVFDSVKDDLDPIDWSNWTFDDGILSKKTCNQEMENSSSNDIVGSLKFDDILNASNPPISSLFLKDVSLAQIRGANEDSSVLTSISPITVDEEMEPYDPLKNQGKDFEVSKAFIHGNVGSHCEQQEVIPQERTTSYCLSRGNIPENGLWTNKYLPEKALEVCGNSESVKFINEWLCLWHATDFRFSKRSYSGDKCLMKDDEYDSYDSDSDVENVEDASSLKNVLLVTGPIGSGKSAAIYACAKEQGFDVIEVNTSDCRNGALLKQKFGEAVASHGLKRTQESPMSKQKIKSVVTNGAAAENLNNGEVEVISLLEGEDYVGHVGSQSHSNGRFSSDKGDIKTLILFEDVDVSLCDDRGFISSIQQLADTGKRPMILTSNNESPLLPDNLDREEVCFTMPSLKELTHHIYQVCSAEKANIHPDLIERCVKFFSGDIRKTLMHLQFWCQSKEYIKDGKLQSISGPLMFNLEAGHCILPKLIPWGLPSLLSEFVEAEVAKSCSRMKEYHSLLGVIEEEEVENTSMQNKLDFDIGETDSIAAKKEAILRGNCYFHVDNGILAGSDACELSNSTGSPVAFARRNIRRKSDTVLSDSEDEICNHENPAVFYGLSGDDNNTLIPAVHSELPCLISALEGNSNEFDERLLHPGATEVEEARNQLPETANANHINFFAMGNSCNQSTDPFVLPAEEKHQHLDFVHANCSRNGQANGSLNLLNDLLLHNNGDGNMIVGTRQSPAVGHEKFLTVCNSRSQSADQPFHFGEANGVEIAKLVTGNAVNLCLQPVNNQAQKCAEANFAVKRCLFPYPADADDPVRASIDSPRNQSNGKLIQSIEPSTAEPQHWHLEMGTVNHGGPIAAVASLNPVFDQLVCHSKGNMETSDQQFPETENANPLCYTALNDSPNPSNDQLFHFVEAKEKEIEHHQSEAGERNHTGVAAGDGPLLQLSDQHFGIGKPDKVQQQPASVADVNHAKCLQLDDSLKLMSEQLHWKQEKTTSNHLLLPDMAIVDVMSCPAVVNSPNPLDGKIYKFLETKAEEHQCQYSDATDVNHEIDQCQSIEMSYVPESTFVPETEINDETECLSGADLMEIVSPVAIGNIDPSSLRHQASDYKLCSIDLNMNARDEEMGDSQSENDHLEPSTSGCPVMDECSRMNFCKRSKSFRSSALEVIDSVQERWNELRQTDLGQYRSSEHLNAFQVLDLGYRISNLISEGDLLLHDHEFLINYSLGQDTGHSEETCTWHDQQAQMAFSTAEYGYFLYAKDIDALQSTMGFANKLHLGWEMLVSTSNSMALGKLLSLDRNQISSADTSIKQAATTVNISLTREREMSLQNVVQSVVPLRSYLTVRGNALHEYLSSLAHISRSEALRLAETAQKTKRRRVRVAKNYLSSGVLDLSEDDITKLNDYNLYGRDSSKSTQETLR